MGIFPQLNSELRIQLEAQSTPELIQPLGKSFMFDFEKGDFIVLDGKVVKVEDIEALKIWIEKTLKTEKFKFKIYERDDKSEYGITIKDLVIGSKLPTSFIYAEIQREVTEALIRHPLIQQVLNFNSDRVRNILTISFTVVLKDERTFNKEVKF